MTELESELDTSESGYQPTDYCWRLGEALPTREEGERLPNSNYTPSTESGENFSGFHDFFQRMVSKIDAAFSELDRKLENIEARVAVIEQRPLAPPQSPSTSSSSSNDDRKRKKCTPPPRIAGN